MASTIENIETRVSEVESIFMTDIQQNSITLRENLANILQHKNSFDEICLKIDNLESFVSRVKGDLSKLERQVQIAEEELDIPETKIDILLKSINIFASRQPPESNLKDGIYEPAEICNPDDYFKS